MLSNNSELFVEISEQQQEVVSGGDIFYGNLNASVYDINAFNNISSVGAGAGGAGAGSITTGIDQFAGSLSLQFLTIT